MLHDRVLAFVFCESGSLQRKIGRKLQDTLIQQLLGLARAEGIERKLAYTLNFAHSSSSGAMWEASRKLVTDEHDLSREAPYNRLTVQKPAPPTRPDGET